MAQSSFTIGSIKNSKVLIINDVNRDTFDLKKLQETFGKKNFNEPDVFDLTSVNLTEVELKIHLNSEYTEEKLRNFDGFICIALTKSISSFYLSK
jgi:hypothetical protein